MPKQSDAEEQKPMHVGLLVTACEICGRNANYGHENGSQKSVDAYGELLEHIMECEGENECPVRPNKGDPNLHVAQVNPNCPEGTALQAKFFRLVCPNQIVLQ